MDFLVRQWVSVSSQIDYVDFFVDVFVVVDFHAGFLVADLAFGTGFSAVDLFSADVDLCFFGGSCLADFFVGPSLLDLLFAAPPADLLNGLSPAGASLALFCCFLGFCVGSCLADFFVVPFLLEYLFVAPPSPDEFLAGASLAGFFVGSSRVEVPVHAPSADRSSDAG